MKLFALIIALLHFDTQLFAISTPMSTTQVNMYLNLLNKFESEQTQRVLNQFKYALINGHTLKAQFYLSEIEHNKYLNRNVFNYWKAVLSFTKGDHKASNVYLNQLDFDNSFNIGGICYFKAVNYVLQSDLINLKANWNECYRLNFTQSYDNLFWPDRIISHITKVNEFTVDPYFINRTSDLDEIKSWLKLHLYLGNSKDIIDNINSFPDNILLDKDIKSLVALHHFKVGNLVDAYKFIKDHKDPNTLLMRTNFHMANNDYTNAISNLKEILKIKSNSVDAYKRLIPLLWLTNQTKEAYDYLRHYHILDEEKTLDYYLLSSIILSKNMEYQKSYDYIKKYLRRKNYAFNPTILTHLRFVSYKLLSFAESKQYSYEACKNLDVLACWQLLKLNVDKEISFYHQDTPKQLNEYFLRLNTDYKVDLGQKSYIEQDDISNMDE